MLKRSFCALLTVLMAMLFCPGAVCAGEEDNLIVNGSFEVLDEEGMPSAWYTEAYIRQAGYTAYAISDDAHSGAASARIHNLGMNDARFAQRVAVEPGALYCLSGWIKVESMEDAGRGANLSIEDLYVFSESVFDADGEWHYVEMYGETGEDQREVTVFARVGGYSGESEGCALFDDLCLRRVDAVPGNGVASLWFRQETPAAVPDEAAGEDGEAAPFWPWLLALSACYLAMAAWMSGRLTREPRELHEKRGAPAFFIAGLAASAVLRLVIAVLVEGYQVDVNCFRAWGYTMSQVGPTAFYQTSSFCDYTPGYLYVLCLNQWLTQLGTAMGLRINAAFYHKLIPMACDLMASFVLYRAARTEGMDRRGAGMLGLLMALLPAAILNSAAWGQMDSVLCLGLLLVACMAVRRQWTALLPTYVLCALIKPQALMLGPLGLMVLVVEWLRRRESRRPMLIGLGLSAAVAAVIILPFAVAQQPGWLIAKYADTLASYPYATVNTANFYYLFSANWTKISSQASLLAAVCLSLLCLGWGTVLVFRLRGRRLAFAEPALMACFGIAFAVMAVSGVSWSVLGAAAMVMCFAVVLPMYIRSGDVRQVPLLGAVLFILLYVLGIKMHERYLFPAFALLGLAFALQRDKRILLLLAVTGCTVFVNEGIVLDNAIRLGSEMGHLNRDTQWLNMLLSAVNVLCVPLAVWTAHRLCVECAQPRREPLSRPLLQHVPVLERRPGDPRTFHTDPSLHWKRLDWALMLSVTAVYAVLALCNLGSAKAPQTSWTSTARNEAVVIDLGEHHDDFSMLYYCQVSYSDFSVAVSEDGESWSEEYWAQMDQGQCYRWKYLVPSYETADGGHNYVSARDTSDVQRLSGRYVRITAQQISLILNEVIFRDADGNRIDAQVLGSVNVNSDSPLSSDPLALLDEQDTLTGEPSWYNSTYFDEIYHARTAYEHLHGQSPYETSHPPLGKVIMSWFIAIFGMTPFGWRFAGALMGILMLPVMYLLGKQLTKRTDMAFASMCLMALDCMHLTQTRIATIDSFPVLFIMLEFLFMARFMQRDIVMEPVKKLLPDLALSGFFMGCGIASKWIGVYAGAGLAVLFFWTCLRHLRLSQRAAAVLEGEKKLSGQEAETLAVRRDTAWRRVIILCLWCLLFFILVPVVIYLLSYIPYFAAVHINGFLDYLRRVISTQEGMFKYHSQPGFGMDHPFYSPWYEWPLIRRPMYYASASFVPEGYSYAIFCFGNPAVWLVGLLGVAGTLGIWARRHCYRLEGCPDRLLHMTSRSFGIAPAFVLIGLLAQFLPWVLVPRGTYIYHYFASIPFLILATVLMLHSLTRRWPRAGRCILVSYLIVCLVFFIGFYPYASGVLTPNWWLDFMSRFLRLYHS